MKSFVIAAAALLLAGCQEPVTEKGYKDMTGQQRAQTLLEADVAACDWEITKTRLAGPGSWIPIGPAFYEQCMEAKGWRLMWAR